MSVTPEGAVRKTYFAEGCARPGLKSPQAASMAALHEIAGVLTFRLDRINVNHVLVRFAVVADKIEQQILHEVNENRGTEIGDPSG